ncbi:MAG: sulfatase [Bacteroidota bacterium]
MHIPPTLRLMLLASLLVGCAPASIAEEEPQPYNILWITCEDMSSQLGCYGDEVARTPVLDSLAELSMRFTRAFAPYGVCSPARTALITGMYPNSIGAQHMRTQRRTSAIADITDPELLAIPTYEAVPPEGVVCFPELLRRAGYFCTNNSKTDYQFATPISAWDENGRSAHWRNREAGQPFFSVINFTITHESQVWKRRKEPLITDPASVEVPPYYPDHPVVREDIARNYDNIALMDSMVGQVLQELKDDGLLDRTIIFFFSDHGSGLPRAKRWVYDSGIEVPLLVRFPDGQGAGTTAEELVSFVDFAPTVLSLLDLPIPDYVQGQAFLGKAKAEPRQYIYAARDRMDPAMARRRAVRDERFKYVRSYLPEKAFIQFLPYRDRMPLMQTILQLGEAGELGPDQWQFTSQTKPEEELYDTQTDPHEIHNLADDPAYAEKLAELRAEHLHWMEEIGDLGSMPEAELIKHLWPPDGVQPEVEAPQFTDEGRLETKTPSASISYRNLGDTRWQLLPSTPLTASGDTLEVVAERLGWKRSDTIQVVMP